MVESRAAIAREAGQPLSIETIQVDGPREGEVMVEIEVNGRHFHGKGVNTDIVAASAQAYLKALNRASVEGNGASTESEPAHGV